MNQKTRKKVTGIANASNTVFAQNPHGWIGISRCIEFPLEEGITLEETLLKVAQESNTVIPINIVKNVKIEGECLPDCQCRNKIK